MSSWREKFSGIAQRAKEVASSTLTSVSETATDTCKAIKSIAGNVQADVARVVEQIREPQETAQAVTTDGQVYTVTVDTGYGPYNGGIGRGSASRAETPQKTAEELEREELAAMIPKNRFMGNTIDEVKSVFKSIGSSWALMKDQRAQRKAATAERRQFYKENNAPSQVARDWSAFWKMVKEPFVKTPATVQVPGNVDNELAYAPTVMNMAADGSNSGSASSSGTKPKRKKRTPPKVKLAYSGSGTGTEQIKYAERRAAQKAPKPPKGPEDPRRGKRALLAALAVMAGSLATYMYADGTFDTTNQAPTASAKAPENTAPAPTTTENKTTKNETPAPTVTSEPDEPKTVEVTPPKEERLTTPTPKHAKTHLPEKDNVYPPVEVSTVEENKEPEVVVNEIPTDLLEYVDAIRINRNLMAQIESFRKDIEFARKLDKEADDKIRSYGGNPTISTEFEPMYEEMMQGLYAAESRQATYNAHVEPLEGAVAIAKKTGSNFDYLNVRGFTDKNMWTERNVAMQTQKIRSSHTKFVQMERTRVARIATAQRNAYVRYFNEALATYNQVTDKNMRFVYASALISLKKRVRNIYSTPSNSNTGIATIQGIGGSQRMDSNIEEAKNIGIALKKRVALETQQAGQPSKMASSSELNTTANSAAKKGYQLRSLQHRAPSPAADAKQTKTSSSDMKLAPVLTPDSDWIPESI